MGTRIQFRRDSSSNWTTNNPVLAEGEMGLELDTRRIKIGNGTTNWNSLPYGIATIGIDELVDVTITNPQDGELIVYDSATSNWVNTSASLVAEQNDLTDTVITNPQPGQYLQYDGTQWVNGVSPTGEPLGHADRTTSEISFDTGSLTFSIGPKSPATEFVVWVGGIKYTYATTQSVTIPDTTGLYYFYFNLSGVLAYKTTYFNWPVEAPTAYLYWNATTSQAIFFADERHGIVLDWQTHEYLHRTRGAAFAAGFGIYGVDISGDGTSDTHVQFSLQNGTFFDEDLQVDIVDSATPTANTWEQELSPATIPLYYLIGTEWTRDNASTNPIKKGTTFAYYNELSGGNWQLSEVANGAYVISWIVATNQLNTPVIAIMGQGEYTNIGDAEDELWETVNLDDFPAFEFRPLYKLIYQTGSYGNTTNSRLRGVNDLRGGGSATGGSGTGTTDHGLLTGLADDDHTQYLNNSRHNNLDHSDALATASIGDLSDVTIASISTDELLRWSGTAWVNTGGITISSTGAVTFNGVNTFPVTAGGVGQYLASDGAGNLEWVDQGASGGEIINSSSSGAVLIMEIGP